MCHSKSGEINPVKVVNLVKAYVDKYKHARKHKKDETGQSQNADVPKDFQTSVWGYTSFLDSIISNQL